MFNWLLKKKKRTATLLTGVLAASILPIPGGTGGVALATLTDGCLTMVGSGSVANSMVERNQMVTINYTLDPGGTHTVTTSRDPIDVAFVADVSGSMDFNMVKDDRRTPKRINILKDASETLTSKFRSVGMNDRLGLIKFSDYATKVEDLTTNYTQIQDRIDALDPGGSTNIDDALTKAKQMLTASGTKPIKQVILLTDGKATMWTDEKDGNKRKTGEASSAAAARASADALAAANIKVYTIALATQGSDEVDLDLLNYIATKTKGQAYQASSATALASIFNDIATTIEAPSALKNVTLRQPIPDGFILAPGENASNVTYDPVTKQVLVNMGDLPYPFQQPDYSIAVHLIPDTAAGNYPLQDARVSYTNACNQQSQFNISLGATLSVSFRIMDKYGNVYYANTDSVQGRLQRKRTGDLELQWSVKEKDIPISDIQFVDADHSIVRITYRDGTKSQWDLKPTAPTDFELKDANGNLIMDNGWHKGFGTISGFSGSVNQLPASTEYGNEDFRDNYIAGFYYSIAGSAWSVFSPGVVLPDGQNIGLSAKAFTNSISSSAAIPLAGAEATSRVSLDSTGPVISWAKTNLDPAEDADITITATENLSPVTGIKVWLDNRSASITAPANRIVQNGGTYTFSFKLSEVQGFTDAATRIGWHQIEYEATSAGGTSTANPDYFVVNPGPTGSLIPVEYSTGEIADRPVYVNVETSHPVVSKYGKPAFTVKDKYYIIQSDAAPPNDASAWRKLPASRFTVTTSTNETKGTYYVFMRLVDDQGIASITPSPLVIQIDTEQNRW
ncbi:vWA domain-containing protein [Paenibacillus koleovorans]|uniref:vWA domain-containing protein n=1 Tax=Paenibacillus koleovorans TaxID=121608 RepID=UPI000FD9917A|nr:vWA domain-containing protein [Paenibacillus koleovorans]